MASHSQIESWWADYRCNTDDLAYLDMNGRYPVKVQTILEPAAVALSAAIMDSGYQHPMGPTGSYMCRKIGGSDTWSLHAYGVAIDWDYADNPYDKGGDKPERGFGTDPRFLLTEANVEAVEAIVNEDGTPIWRWLGWTIADFMHFQVDVPPDKCQPAQEEPMVTHYNIGTEYAEWEEISWLLFMLGGGTVNPNRGSHQVTTELPYKTNVKLVQAEDFDLIAAYTAMSDTTRADMDTDGLYRFGLEIASLRQQAWT